MDRQQIKTYIILFSGIFVLLLFVTWQQVAIFRLGYRITHFKKEIVKEEIRKQQLLEKLHVAGSLISLEYKATNLYKMSLPKPEECWVIKIDKNKLFLNNSKRTVSLITYLRDIFSPSDAQAR